MRLFPISVILLLAWGALAVGGSPSWAAAPVAVFAVTTGILGFLARRESALPRAARTMAHRPVAFALCLFLAAIGVQLVPLPASVVRQWSPSRDVVEFERLLATADRRDPELVPRVADDAPRPLSIAPARTWWGLGLAAAIAFYLIGASYGLSAVGISGISGMVVGLGAFVAFLEIYQFANGNAFFFGWYVPLNIGSRSAPFVNRNHQAGWLVMVLSLTLGLFAGHAARGLRGVAPIWRERVIWFSSREASVAILSVFGAVIMAIAILTTQSRSGALALLSALTVLGLLSARRQSSNARRGVAVISLAAVALIAFFTSGSAVMKRFAAVDGIGAGGRLALWQDSWRILNDFSTTGTGFNTYGVSMLHYQTVSGFRYIEAHNDYLQLAVEGGWLLGVPALILLACLGIEIRRRFRERADDTRTYWVRIGAVTGMLGIALQSIGEFTLQMPGAAVMFATLLAIAIHHPRPRVAGHERAASPATDRIAR